MPCDLAAHPAGRPRPRPAGDRGRRLRHRLGDPPRRRPGSRIGKPHGDIVCFSFHPRKVHHRRRRRHADDGEPGVGRAASACGASTACRCPTPLRHGSPTVIFEDYPVQGFNYRMTDVQAAIGREQLKRLPGIVAAPPRARRRATPTLLAGLDGVTAPARARLGALELAELLRRASTRDFDQRGVMQHMLDRGVATRRGIMCIHREAAHADLPQRAPAALRGGAGPRDPAAALSRRWTDGGAGAGRRRCSPRPSPPTRAARRPLRAHGMSRARPDRHARRSTRRAVVSLDAHPDRRPRARPLAGSRVVTEAATGAYACTAPIAAMAGARRHRLRPRHPPRHRRARPPPRRSASPRPPASPTGSASPRRSTRPTSPTATS